MLTPLFDSHDIANVAGQVVHDEDPHYREQSAEKEDEAFHDCCSPRDEWRWGLGRLCLWLVVGGLVVGGARDVCVSVCGGQ